MNDPESQPHQKLPEGISFLLDDGMDHFRDQQVKPLGTFVPLALTVTLAPNWRTSSIQEQRMLFRDLKTILKRFYDCKYVLEHHHDGTLHAHGFCKMLYVTKWRTSRMYIKTLKDNIKRFPQFGYIKVDSCYDEEGWIRYISKSLKD